GSRRRRSRAPPPRRGAGSRAAASAASGPRASRRSRSSFRSVEAIPEPADGRDRYRVADLLAHLRDVHVDGARVAEPVVAPHAVEDLLARERETRPLREEAQELE